MKRTIKKEERKFWVERGFQDPLIAFRSHKMTAKQRGIAFLFCFDDWWDMWAPSYHLRGTSKGCFCMCRTADSGPYAVWNVRIDTVESNQRERVITQKRKAIHEAWGGRSDGIEWMSDRLSQYDPLSMLERCEENC